MLSVDLEIKLSSITKLLKKELENLSPHGEGNPVPVFATRDVKGRWANTPIRC